MTAHELAHTILVVAYRSGDWLIASQDQTPEMVAKLRIFAERRACCLVRYPLNEFHDEHRRIDFSLAEEMV